MENEEPKSKVFSCSMVQSYSLTYLFSEMRPEIDYVQNQGKTCLDKYGDKDSKMKELKMILANVNVNWEFIESW